MHLRTECETRLVSVHPTPVIFYRGPIPTKNPILAHTGGRCSSFLSSPLQVCWTRSKANSV
ncbi:hypothetical protein BDY19DRAFT_974726 [Irpex rosettiformis]|uniref:Uncharacterized protein n=1 Tax=Irpex rosettiformis TaxID=378272 RepID=A0ACB8TPS0_9APHY|nr:hypothetical protein BDY19DRAFT_974726 [Irpex rosettiformis]